MDLTRQMQSQPYLLSFFKTMLTDDSLSPIFDYHQKFLFQRFRETQHLFKMWHNEDAASALNFELLLNRYLANT